MKSSLYLYVMLCVSLCVITISGCITEPDTPVKKRFPSTFLETGNDNDHSYTSLKSSRLDNDHLKLEVTGWGIEETGVFLQTSVENDVLFAHVMGECGTTLTKETWVKRTFVYIVDESSEDRLNLIRAKPFILEKE